MKINNDFELIGLNLPQEVIDQKDKVVEIIQKKVEEMLSSQPDLLFSYLYRMDVLEKNIKSVLKYHTNASKGLSELIYEKLMQKVQYRKKYGKTNYIDED